MFLSLSVLSNHLWNRIEVCPGSGRMLLGMTEPSLTTALSPEVKSWPLLPLLNPGPHCAREWRTSLLLSFKATCTPATDPPISSSRARPGQACGSKWHSRRGPPWEMPGGAGLRAQVRWDGVDSADFQQEVGPRVTVLFLYSIAFGD